MSNKNLFLIIFITLFMSILGGCGNGGNGSELNLVTDDDVVLVEVDGVPVTLPMLEFLMEVRGIDETDTEGMRELLDELIKLRAVANRADEERVSSQPRVRAERMVKDTEVQYVRYLEQFQRDNPISEEQIRSVYEAQIERAGGQRFRLETIEFPEQSYALAQLDALQAGETAFDQALELASAEGRVVRRTDWIDASQVPVDFAAVLAATRAGDIVESLLPYQSNWLIVRIAEVDALAPPSLDEVREGIRRTLVREQSQSLIEQTFERANIKPMLPLGDAPKELP